MENENHTDINYFDEEAKCMLEKKTFFLLIILTICIVIFKLFLHKYNILYYGLEIIAFLSVWVISFAVYFREKINVFSKIPNINLTIIGKTFEIINATIVLVYVLGSGLLMFLYPQKVLIIGLYIPVWVIPVFYYLYRAIKNKNLISKKDIQQIKTMLSSKFYFVMAGSLYGILMELYFSYFYGNNFNIITALMSGGLFAILMYITLSKLAK